MRKFVGIILAVVGALLTVAGIIGIALIGSDDIVDSPASTLALGDAKAVVSTPGLLAFKDTTLRVSASSSGGSVFIGRAHPVDAADYTNGAPTYAVTRVDASGVQGKALKGDADATLADPAKQTFWTDQAAGTGTQTLELDLDGTPTTYVVMPTGKPGDITLASGVKVSNGFALSIAAVVLGLVAIVSGIVLLRRRRTPDADLPDGDSAASPENAGGTATTDALVPGQPAQSSRTMTRVAALVAVGALVPTLSGCGMVPTKVEAWKSDSVTKQALTHDEAVAVMKDYDVRNNAAIKAAAATHDTTPWAKADADAVLAADLFGTQLRRVRAVKEAPAVGTTVANRTFSPAFGTYPMYALVSTTETFGKGKPTERLVAMRRDSVTAPWLKVGSAPAPLKSLPAARTEPAEAFTEAETKAITTAVNGLTSQINSGKGGPALPKELVTTLNDSRTLGQYLRQATLTAGLWNSRAQSPLAGDASIQAARAAKGSVVLVEYLLNGTYLAKDGTVIEFTDKDFAAVTGQTGQRSSIRYRQALTIAMTLDETGKATVVGHSLSRLV
ncbi:hypothetical protein [Knoellia subterranea]|uniref:Uncharacterized protein n=1 Tax=Knoellia subterranea KCTC 19937 TaxID=1385521 RepID=A0A0A0JS96_9MICO|nr:hypothetical protein [Knoellia subterranea]KGN39559.1 hypothetical protein N803_00990 [Knoellia subterranea KCTC 19937]